MPEIKKVSWGKIKIDNQDYHQVLLIGDQVRERKSSQLHQLFGTTHRIGDWEKKKLLSGKPEILLIATGWSGLVKVTNDFKKELVKRKIELETMITPKAVKRYNQLVKEGKRVNALIHTTC